MLDRDAFSPNGFVARHAQGKVEHFFLKPIHDELKGFALASVRKQLAYVRFIHQRLPRCQPGHPGAHQSLYCVEGQKVSKQKFAR